MAVLESQVGEVAGQVGGDVWRVRAEIDRVDEALVDLLGERVRLAREAAEVKQAAGLPVVDLAREAAVVRRAGALAREAGVPCEEVRAIFWQVVALSRRAQREGA